MVTNDAITGGSGNDTLNGDAAATLTLTGARTDTPLMVVPVTTLGGGSNYGTIDASVHDWHDQFGHGCSLGITAVNTIQLVVLVPTRVGRKRWRLHLILDGAMGIEYDHRRTLRPNDIWHGSGATIVQAAAYDTATDTDDYRKVLAGSADTTIPTSQCLH